MYALVTLMKAMKTLVIFLAFILTLLVLMFFALTYYRPAEPVRLNEVLLNPAKVGWEDGFIELTNTGGEPVGIDGWELRTKAISRRLTGSIRPGEQLTLYGEIAQSDGDVYLVDSRGFLIDTYKSGQSSGTSQGRYPDGTGAWTSFDKPTPGEPNTIGAAKAQTPVPYMPECMVDEFNSESARLREKGYRADADAFCKDFKERMFEERPEVRRKISEAKDQGFRETIVDEVADRRIAGERENRAAKMTVTEGDLLASIGGLLGVEPSGLGLDGEVREMNMKFRNMLYDLASNGSAAEREDMASQIDSYLKNRSQERKSLVIEPDNARQTLATGNQTLCGTGEYRIC